MSDSSPKLAGSVLEQVVKTLDNIETTLILLFEQQRHLTSGSLSHTDEQSLFASQLSLMIQMKSAVQLARVMVWGLIVPTIEESAPEVTVYRCEPNEDDEEEQATSTSSNEIT